MHYFSLLSLLRQDFVVHIVTFGAALYQQTSTPQAPVAKF
jgi:hypothetical protein